MSEIRLYAIVVQGSHWPHFAHGHLRHGSVKQCTFRFKIECMISELIKGHGANGRLYFPVRCLVLVGLKN